MLIRSNTGPAADENTPAQKHFYVFDLGGYYYNVDKSEKLLPPSATVGCMYRAE
jgi:hypothetical protein